MAKTMESDVNEVSRISTGTVIKGSGWRESCYRW